MARKTVDKWQYGDFQTPLDLARKVAAVLRKNHNIQPDIIIEPTCGKGAFVVASSEVFHEAKILGFELNPAYVTAAMQTLESSSASRLVSVEVADFFDKNWESTLLEYPGYLLIIGNPPWVTSSELGLLNSQNLPEKSNFQNRKGIEAITGSANFDISEWMLLQHVQWLSKRKGAIAFLCKYAVARKVMRQMRKNTEQRFSSYIYPIDAKKHFDAAVEACLFVLVTDRDNIDCQVYAALGAISPSHTIGERDGFIVFDVDKYQQWRHLKGQDAKYIWRSGVKHDCARVMELMPYEGDDYKNGLDEIVAVEQDFIYPLLKSSDVANGRVASFRKVVLITQKAVGEDTVKIRNSAPQTWRYLLGHREYLDRRKSAIYKNKPPFSIFGIGHYSFKPWKIAISGLYKTLQFNLIGPLEGKTVMFDDTVNFLSFDSQEEAEFIHRLVTSPPATAFFESMIFLDEKRPVTTEVLRRLSFRAVAEELGEFVEYQRWNQSMSESAFGQLALGIAEEKASYNVQNTTRY